MGNFKTREGAAAVLLMTAVLVGCQEGRVAPPVTSADDHLAPAVTVKKILALYEGILPCADCQGIRTKLTLFDEDFTYRLVEVYLGTPDGDRTVESGGTWTTLQGTGEYPTGTIYRLNPGKPEDVRSFLVVNEAEIEQLDRGGRKIESRGRYTLTKTRPLADVALRERKLQR